jgi:cytochrome P450
MYSERSFSSQTANLGTAPGPRGYPLLGTLPYMRKGPHEFFLRTALEYGGVAHLGRPDRILVAHPDGIKHVLQDNHHNYLKGKYVARLRLLMGNGHALRDGASWLRQRRLIQPAFHRQRLAGLATVITDLTAGMLGRWQRMAAHDQSIDVATEMRHLTQQIVVKIMFGAELGDTEIETIGHAFATIVAYIDYRTVSLLPLPQHWPTPRNRSLNQAQHLLDQVVRRMIEERRGSATDNADLLSMLLTARDEETGEGMSDQQIYDEIRTIFFGGYDTTSNALAWVWYVLARYPDVEQRLHEELAMVLGERTPTYQDLPQLTYLHRVIEETLRLYPPAWVVVRTVIADDLIDGYHIPAGAKIVISPYVTHRLPTLWERPDIFDPERFTPERSAGRHRCAYIPFGTGPRLCIGSNLAMLETQLIVAMVAQIYRLRVVAGSSIRPYPSITLQPRNGIPMHLHQR